MTDYEKIISELREEIKQSREEIKQLKSINDSLVKSVNELKQKLAYYENPHSPPSQNSLLYRKQKAEKRQKSKGTSNRGGSWVTKVQHRYSSHKEYSIMNYLHAPNVTVPTSLKLNQKDAPW